MRRISRRLFLSTSSAAAALPLIRTVRLDAQVEPVFRHGVASGDPLTDRVMLWTRVSVPTGHRPSVSWVMARDPELARIVARGEQQTGAGRDFTVKVDVGGLEPGTTYYYRFEAAKAQSPIGRTRTLPARGASRIRLGVASCSNYPFGYFNAYAALARARRSRRGPAPRRLHLRVRQRRLRRRHARLGRIPQPERARSSRSPTTGAPRAVQGGSRLAGRPPPASVHRRLGRSRVRQQRLVAAARENHNPEKGEGDWFARRNAAVQAYFEWMPIREDAAGAQPAHLPHAEVRRSRRPRPARHAAGGARSAGGLARRCGRDRVAGAIAARDRRRRRGCAASWRNRSATARAGRSSGSR